MNQDNQMMSIYEAITYHYKELMNITRREYYSLYTKKDKSEDDDSFKDIAHDTLLKMCDIFDKFQTTLGHIKAYFCKAIRMNYIKNLVTTAHKYAVDYEITDNTYNMVAESSYDENIDLNRIIEDITQKFGERDSEIFQRFYEGDTLRELNEEYNINNAAYIVRKIRNYITSHYYGYNIKRLKNN